MDELKRKFVAGFFWSASGTGAAQVVQFFLTAALAHLLAPRDFGLVAMGLVAVGIGAGLNELGLGSALVQIRDLRREHLNGAFFVVSFLGVLLNVAVFLAAPAAAALYREPAVVPFFHYLSFLFLVNSLSAVPRAFLQREMRFGWLGAADVARPLAYGACAIPTALAGKGAWSLVAGELAAAAAYCGVVFAGARWAPGLRWRFRDVTVLFRFGLKIMAASSAYRFRENAIFFLIGRYLGTSALGGFNIIYKLINFPMTRFTWVLTRVSFPGFSAMKGDDALIARSYGKIVKLSAFVGFGFTAWLAVSAKPFISIVYGPGWLFCAEPLMVLCLAGALFAFNTNAGSVVMAKGRPGLELLFSAVGAVIFPSSVIVGSRYGLLGAAVGISVAAALFTVFVQYLTVRLIGWSARAFLLGLLRPAVFGLAVGTAARAAIVVTSSYPQSVQLAFAAVFAAAVAVPLFIVFNLREAASVIRLLVERVRTRPRAAPAFVIKFI